jgi:flagellar biosynthesis protein FlhG
VSSKGSDSVRLIAVASGKGGVGKTNASVNLAVSLARQGERTLLVDCDMGLANAGILLGIDSAWTIADLLSRHCELDDLIRRGPSGVAFLPGHSGTGVGSDLPDTERRRLFAELRGRGAAFDQIIIDTAGGIGAQGLSLVAEADVALIVMAPEPTSFVDAYALVKALAVGHGRTDFVLLTNMVENDEAGVALFDHFKSVITRFLDVELEHAGSVPLDPYVRQAVLRKRCCVDVYPSARASKAFGRIARKLTEPVPIRAAPTPIATMEQFHGLD